MIHKWRAGDGEVAVRFSIPVEWLDRGVSVVGEFNGWDHEATPMGRAGSVLSAVVVVDMGRCYRFRYLDDRGRWHDDPDADDVVANGRGGTDCVVDVRVPPEPGSGPTGATGATSTTGAGAAEPVVELASVSSSPTAAAPTPSSRGAAGRKAPAKKASTISGTRAHTAKKVPATKAVAKKRAATRKAAAEKTAGAAKKAVAKKKATAAKTASPRPATGAVTRPASAAGSDPD